MRTTTKLKHLLQLYSLNVDMEDENFHLTLFDKRNRNSATFVAGSWSAVVAKAFGHMMKKIKDDH